MQTGSHSGCQGINQIFLYICSVGDWVVFRANTVCKRRNWRVLSQPWAEMFCSRSYTVGRSSMCSWIACMIVFTWMCVVHMLKPDHQVSTEVKLVNPTAVPLTIQTQSSLPSVFTMKPSSFRLAPFQSNSCQIIYTPSCINQLQRAEIRFISDLVWTLYLDLASLRWY